MKSKVTLSLTILLILVLLVNKLTGNTRIKNDPKWIVPALIIDNDTVPVVYFPAIIIDGNSKKFF